MKVLVYGFQQNYCLYSWWNIFKLGLEEWKQTHTDFDYRILSAPHSITKTANRQGIVKSEIIKQIVKYEPDVILLVWKASYLIFDILRELKPQLGFKVAQWHCDFVPLDQKYQGWRESAPDVLDFLFVSNSGDIEYFHNLGIKCCSFLPQATPTLEKAPSKQDEDYICDIGFIGLADLDGNYPQFYESRRVLLQRLLDKGYNLKIFPSDQAKYANAREKTTIDLPKIYASCKVTINATCQELHDKKHYHSNRLYYATGFGNCFLTWYSNGINDIFRPSVHLDTFEGIYEAEDKIRHYLENKSDRERIRYCAFELAQKKHRFVNRWSDLLRTIETNTGYFGSFL